MDTRSALRWTAKAREGAGVRSPEIAAEVAEAASAMVVSVFSGARLVSIEIGCGAAAACSGAGATRASRAPDASGADGGSALGDPLPLLRWFPCFRRYRRSSATRL